MAPGRQIRWCYRAVVAPNTVSMRPPEGVEQEEHLDGFTARLPNPRHGGVWVLVRVLPSTMGFVLLVVLGVLLGAGDIAPGLSADVAQVVGIIIALTGIPLAVLVMRAIEYLLLSYTRTVSLRGMDLTLTSRRRTQTIELADVACVEEAAVLRMRDGTRILLAAAHRDAVQAWLSHTLDGHLRRQNAGTPSESPDAMRPRKPRE